MGVIRGFDESRPTPNMVTPFVTSFEFSLDKKFAIHLFGQHHQVPVVCHESKNLQGQIDCCCSINSIVVPPEGFHQVEWHVQNQPHRSLHFCSSSELPPLVPRVLIWIVSISISHNFLKEARKVSVTLVAVQMVVISTHAKRTRLQPSTA
jgi:hypothetical protein